MHHVRIALGSLAELETQLEIARRLGLLSPDDLAKVEKELARTGQLLNGVIRSVRRHQLKALGSAGLVLAVCLLFV